MASPYFDADLRFPQLSGEKSTDEKFRVLTDYLYQLLELLRYTLNNLDSGNMNQTALTELRTSISDMAAESAADALTEAVVEDVAERMISSIRVTKLPEEAAEVS